MRLATLVSRSPILVFEEPRRPTLHQTIYLYLSAVLFHALASYTNHNEGQQFAGHAAL